MVTPWLAGALIVALLLFGIVWAGQRRMMYFPYRDLPAPAAVGLSAAQEVSFQTEDGISLGGWFVPAAGLAAPRFTVIVFNGNAGNRSYRAPLAAALARRGVATLLFDYRGYGENEGSPSEHGLTLDARAAHFYATTRPDVDPARLVYFGESLGTAVALRLAVEKPPTALVLRSPFTSFADMGRHHYPILPVRLLLRDRYSSIDVIRRLEAPLLVIAGDSDELVPITQSEKMYAAARDPKRFLRIGGAMHNDYDLLAGDALVDGLVEFVNSAIDR
jgi:fermentation-respiration switch protein FrsA (DUF1100 family)